MPVFPCSPREVPSSPLVQHIVFGDLLGPGQARPEVSSQSASSASLPDRLHDVRKRFCIVYLFGCYVFGFLPCVGLWILWPRSHFADGRHFKAIYGKDLVESLLSSSDAILSEIERPVGDRLSLQQNQTSSLQGQIDLLRSHQAVQDQRISFALAREAEEADRRINER